MLNFNGPDSIHRRQVHELVLLQKYADIITDSVFKKIFGDERLNQYPLFHDGSQTDSRQQTFWHIH